MYILYRLLKAFVKENISTSYFCNEFSLIYCRYEGITEIEEKEFNIFYTKELELLFDQMNNSCSMYYEDLNTNEGYPYPTEQYIKEEANRIFKLIEEKKIFIIK